MAIEPTDEMMRAFLEAWDRENRIINESAGEYVEVGARDRMGVAAVLAIVERDHRVEARCADSDCERKAQHPGEHGCFDGREWVRW